MRIFACQSTRRMCRQLSKPMLLDCSPSCEKVPIRFGYTSNFFPHFWQRDSCLCNFEAHFEAFVFLLRFPCVFMANTGEAAHRNEWSVYPSSCSTSAAVTYRTHSLCDRRQAGEIRKKELEKEQREHICKDVATQFKHCVRSWACFLCLDFGVVVLGARRK